MGGYELLGQGGRSHDRIRCGPSRFFERKNLIYAKAQLASVIAGKYHSGKVLNLFFPFANSYTIMEFLVYLNYRGIPIKSAALAKTATAQDYHCMKYRDIICHPSIGPGLDDLVVVLPDDEASMAEAWVYRKPGTLLFYYEPRWPIAHRLYPLVSTYPLSPGESRITFPDRWMDASVAVWRGPKSE